MTQAQPEATAPETEPLKISRVGALEAARDGGEAARSDEDPSTCPFLPVGDDIAREFHAHHWFKGFHRALNA